jgi:hypothetical protein
MEYQNEKWHLINGKMRNMEDDIRMETPNLTNGKKGTLENNQKNMFACLLSPVYFRLVYLICTTCSTTKKNSVLIPEHSSLYKIH